MEGLWTLRPIIDKDGVMLVEKTHNGNGEVALSCPVIWPEPGRYDQWRANMPRAYV